MMLRQGFIIWFENRDPLALRDLGFKKDGNIPRAAELAVQNQYYNPRPVSASTIAALLEDAWFGNLPRVSA